MKTVRNMVKVNLSSQAEKFTEGAGLTENKMVKEPLLIKAVTKEEENGKPANGNAS